MRLLFVAMAHSIHTVRWMSQVRDRGWDVHLFPVEEGLNPALRDVTIHAHPSRQPAQLEGVRFSDPRSRAARARAWLSTRGPAGEAERNRVAELARVLQQFQPEVVHSLEMLKAGRLVRLARAHVRGSLPRWIVSHWGSELFLLAREPESRRELEAILAECAFFTAECERDVRRALELGFRGTVLPLFPVAGGFDLGEAQRLRSGPPSTRRVVTVKGYHGWTGRALVALSALERCEAALQGYQIVIHSADPAVVHATAQSPLRLRVPIDVLPPSPHQEMLRLHGRSRVSIGLSLSDGMSTSLLEAIVMGSFPIQSHTCCAGEWLHDGRTASFVPPEDPAAVAAAIDRALRDDRLVDDAAIENARLVQERLDQRTLTPRVAAMYERVKGGAATEAGAS